VFYVLGFCPFGSILLESFPIRCIRWTSFLLLSGFAITSSIAILLPTFVSSSTTYLVAEVSADGFIHVIHDKQTFAYNCTKEVI